MENCMSFQVCEKTYGVCIYSRYTQDAQSEISRKTAPKLLNGINYYHGLVQKYCLFKCFVPVCGNIALNCRN